MQKYLKMLEDHCQWVALGIGGLYVLWMIWSSVIQNPVAVDVNGQMMAPGEVDSYTVKNGVEPLEAAMKNSGTITPPNVAEIASAWLARISSPKPIPPVALGVYNPSGNKAVFEPINDTVVGPDGKQQPPVQPQVLVKLPELAPPTNLLTSTGRSGIAPPVNAAVPVPAVAPAAAGTPAQPPTVDRMWVSVKGTVSVAAIDKAFTDAQVPNFLFNTFFLKVELEREELLPDGKTWGGTTVVPPLSPMPTAPYPGDVPAAPGPMVDAFKTEATAHQGEILQPPFLAVINGDKWWLPGDPNPNVPVVTPVVNPQPPVPPKPPVIRPRPQPTPRMIPRNPKDRDMYAPRDDDRPMTLAQAYPVRPPPGPMMPPEMFEGAPMGPGPGAAPVNVPTGAFNPKPQPGQPAMPDFNIVAHDDTVVAGKTYHYRLRYKLMNPVYQILQAVDPKHPEFARAFALTSANSEWTGPILISSSTKFFISTLHPSGRKAKIDIYRWQAGKNEHKSVEVGVGDEIGVTAEDNVFATGWTVVDFRASSRDPNQQVLIVVDANGRIATRDPSADMRSSEYKDLQRETAPKPAPGAEGQPEAGM